MQGNGSCIYVLSSGFSRLTLRDHSSSCSRLVGNGSRSGDSGMALPQLPMLLYCQLSSPVNWLSFWCFWSVGNLEIPSAGTLPMPRICFATGHHLIMRAAYSQDSLHLFPRDSADASSPINTDSAHSVFVFIQNVWATQGATIILQG